MKAEHPQGALDIPILYEDNHLLVVVKPPGIPSQEDESGDLDMLTLLKQDLKLRYNKTGNVFLGLVHRLDRPVGGVMLFAKTSKAASRMSEAVRSRNFNKTYAAVVTGRPGKNADRLKHYLVKDSRTNTVACYPSPVTGSKEALLDYAIVASDGKHSLVAVKLHTGRPHQIRVQLASIGCPLAGDHKYGSSQGKSGHSNIALWSTSIRVDHPITRESLLFRSIPPLEKPWSLWDADVLEESTGKMLGEEPL
ncbi:RluA family pseudouridine synthase [Paenibacillus sp. GCM10012307]|uniref:RNA pseudouridylate synthase n=1 Tax=Paenibacillus roseus TaxID=2798579 RepID=A0A934MS65_9BACL|nr:RNA pseudouridine synthase [Paenibacillus roseus]MBJ6363608.1 RNA pseudouridine synthase [Paenibacillus roseus]